MADFPDGSQLEGPLALFLEEPGVLNGNDRLVGHGLAELDFPFSELSVAAALAEVNKANHSTPYHQRYDQRCSPPESQQSRSIAFTRGGVAKANAQRSASA